MKKAGAVLALLFLAQETDAGVTEALAAADRGDIQAAIAEFSTLAKAGDPEAMITIALYYHQGRGVPQDYGKAMDWYLQAFSLFDGDAYNNIGVMYRDGEGVVPNRKIAFDLFLITHMRGLGTETTQYRAGRNLDRERSEQSEAERPCGPLLHRRVRKGLCPVAREGLAARPGTQSLALQAGDQGQRLVAPGGAREIEVRLPEVTGPVHSIRQPALQNT